MKFTLEKISSNASVVKFDVKDSTGICGRISVAPEDENDLLACWRGSTSPSAASTTATDRDKQRPAVAAMLRAAQRNKVTKQAVLRGCC